MSPIEQDPRLAGFIAQGAQVETLVDDIATGEGPVWLAAEGCLVFSEVGFGVGPDGFRVMHNGRTLKWDETFRRVTVVREPTDMGNGMALDPQGRLIVCETASRSVKRVELDGTITTVADIYRGLRLNAPNDVVVKSDGSIYFTDPGGLLPGKDLRDDSAVFRVSADLTCINWVAGGFQLVNGLAFSPDETILYINDSQGIHAYPDSFFSQGTIQAYDVRPGGMLANPRLFSELRGPESGMPDGMKVDSAGNVYCTAPGGVWVIDPAGRHVGTIRTGVKHNLTDTTNMAWGGAGLKTLYITTSSSLMAIQMCIAGIPTTFDRHRTGKTT